MSIATNTYILAVVISISLPTLADDMMDVMVWGKLETKVYVKSIENTTSQHVSRRVELAGSYMEGSAIYRRMSGTCYETIYAADVDNEKTEMTQIETKKEVKCPRL